MSEAKIFNLNDRRLQKKQIMDFWLKLKTGQISVEEVGPLVNALYQDTGKSSIYTFLRMLPTLDAEEQLMVIFTLGQLPLEAEVVEILHQNYQEAQEQETKAQIIAVLVALGVDVTDLDDNPQDTLEILNRLHTQVADPGTRQFPGESSLFFSDSQAKPEPLNPAGNNAPGKSFVPGTFYQATVSITREESFIALTLGWEQKDSLITGVSFILDFSSSSPSYGIAEFWAFQPLSKEQFDETFLQNVDYLDPNIQLTTTTYTEALALLQEAHSLNPDNLPQDPYWKKFSWLLTEKADLDEQSYRLLNLKLVVWPNDPEGLLQAFHNAYAVGDYALVYNCLEQNHPWCKENRQDFTQSFSSKELLINLDQSPDFQAGLSYFAHEISENRKEALSAFRITTASEELVLYGKFILVQKDRFWLIEQGEPANLAKPIFHQRVTGIILEKEGLVGAPLEKIIDRANELVKMFDYPAVPYLLEAALKKLPARSPLVLPAMLQLATVKLRLGDIETAVEILQQLAKKPNYPVYAARALKFLDAIKTPENREISSEDLLPRGSVDYYLIHIFDLFDLPPDQCIYALTLWSSLPRFTEKPIQNSDLEIIAAAVIYNAYRLDRGRRPARNSRLAEYLAQLAGDWSKLQLKANEVWKTLGELGQDLAWIKEEAMILFSDEEEPEGPYGD